MTAVFATNIVARISEAREKNDVKILLTAFEELEKLQSRSSIITNSNTIGDVECVDTDLPLLCCEAAIFLHDMQLAKKCLMWLIQGSTTTRATQIRTLYCRALVGASESKSVRRETLIQVTIDALAKLIQGMKMALEDITRLSSLLFIGTQHIWNISRILFKKGTYESIVSAIGFCVHCLGVIDHNDWTMRVNWMLRYAVALQGSNRNNEASAYLVQVADFSAKHAPHMNNSVFKMQVFVGGNPKLNADAKGILKAIYISQAFLSGGALENSSTNFEAALVCAFQEIISKNVTEQTADKPIETPRKATKMGSKGAIKNETPEQIAEKIHLRDDVLCDMALCFLIIRSYKNAEECVGFLNSSKDLKPRIFGEYVDTFLSVEKQHGFSVGREHHVIKLTPALITVLVTAVKKVERSIETAMRLTSPQDRTHTTQIGCLLLWTIALPLLQSNTRSLINRSLHFAAKVLDDTESNMNELRALLHYEGAIGDMDNDYLNKAIQSVHKALSIDYSPNHLEAQMYSLDRPLDRLFMWTLKQLEIRLNIYKTQKDPVNDALLIIEHAREAPISKKVTMLTQAISIMAISEPSVDYLVEVVPNAIDIEADEKAKDEKRSKVDKKGENLLKGKSKKKIDESNHNHIPEQTEEMNPEVISKRHYLRDRAQIWYMIMNSGWKEKCCYHVEVARFAAEKLLCRTWWRKADRDMRIMQFEANITLAEVINFELRHKNLKIAQIHFSSGDSESESEQPRERAACISTQKKKKKDMDIINEVAEQLTQVSNATQAVQDHIVSAATIAHHLIREGFPDQYLLLNAAIFLWNTFVGSFQDSNFLSASSSLDCLFPLMMDPSNGIDPKGESVLFQDIGYAYVRSLIQNHIMNKIAPAGGATSATIIQVVETSFNTCIIPPDPQSVLLQKAYETCNRVITALRTPMEAKNFLMISTTIRRLQGHASDPRVHPQEQLLSIISEINIPGISVDQQQLVLRGYELLSQDPNIELCALFAEKALKVNSKMALRAALVGNALYEEGKIGLKQNEEILVNLRRPLTVSVKEGKDNKKKTTEATQISQQNSQSQPAVAIQPLTDCPQDWMWLSLLLQYQAASIVSLINPQFQNKKTQFEIQRQALVALADSTQAALKAPQEFIRIQVMKNMRHFRNVSKELASDPITRQLIFDSLNRIISDETLACVTPICNTLSGQKRGTLSDADVLGQLMLLKLKIISENKCVDDGIALMKSVVDFLPSSNHKPFWCLDIQLRCEAGLPTTQTLLRVKEYNVETQAQAWLSLARYTKDPTDQLFSYQKAIELLEKKPTEQAEIMVAMAQWALYTNASVSLDEVVRLIVNAVDLVSVRGEIQQCGSENLTPGNSISQRLGASRNNSQNDSVNTIKHYIIAIRAYYLLAKISGCNSKQFDRVIVSRSLSIRMVIHYVICMWSMTVESANSYVRKAKARYERLHAEKELADQQSSTVKALEVKDVEPIPKENITVSSRGDKKDTSRASAPTQQPSIVKRETLERPEFPSPVEVPLSPQGWVGFVVPPSLIATIRQNVSSTSLNSTTDNLDGLIGVLRDVMSCIIDEGMELYGASILAMIELLVHLNSPSDSQIDLCNRVIISEARLIHWDICHKAGAPDLAPPLLIVNVMPSAEESAILSEDIRMIQNHKPMNQKYNSNDVSVRPSVVVDNEEGSNHPIYHYWIAISNYLLLHGRIGQVTQILTDAKSHAEAYSDSMATVQCQMLIARLDHLEGRFTESNRNIDEVLKSYPNDVTHIVQCSNYIDAKMLQVENYLICHDYDSAFKTQADAQQFLAHQMKETKGLINHIAKNYIPELQCSLAFRFSKEVLIHVKAQKTIYHTQPKKKAHMGCIDDAATEEAIFYSLRGVIAQVNPQLEYCLHMTSSLLLIDQEINHFEIKSLMKKKSFLQAKAVLQKEEKALEEAIITMRLLLNDRKQTIETTQSSIINKKLLEEIRKLYMAKGCNLALRVYLNQILVEEYRNSPSVDIFIPEVAGAPKELHDKLIKFMKSSSKQQTAMTRRSRQQKQPQVETHEQSHKEEIIIAVNDSDDHQIVIQQSPIETQIVIPDVVSNDKNDIKPGNISDDECIYDEEEMAFALHGLPDIEKEVKLNYGDALFCFSKASEFAEGNPLKSAKSEGVSQYFTGHVLRIMAESEVILKDQRAAIMAGIDQTTVDSRDSLIAKKWNIPIEVITVTEEEIQVAKRAVSGGPGRKEERQSTKKSGVSTSKAASNISVSKENPVQKEGTTSTLPVTFPGTISCDIAYDIHDTSLVRQSVTVLLQGAINAYVCNEYQLLSNIMREISQCAVLKGNTTLCGQAIEYAQGAAMNHYLHTLWAEITAPDTPEASIVRLISHLRKTSAHIETSSHFKGILNSLHLHSPMHARLSLPEPTFSHTEALGAAKANLPVDFCSLTFHLAEALNIIGTEITCTFRRPNGHLANRRMVVSTDTLDELCQRYELISVERQNQLSGPSARDPEAIRKLDSKYSEYIADTETFLSPLLDDGMRAAMHAVAQNCHLVILLHPVLMPLPFEGMYDIMKFKTVSRDISVFSTIKRINRKMTETKLPVQQAKFAVDPFNENNKLSHLVMFGEEKPQNSNWSLLGSSIDQHGLSHPIQSGRIVKEISCSQGVAPITNTLVVNMPGRFTGLLPLSELAPLSLEHLRAVFIIDKSVIEKAIRRENQQNMNKTYHILRHETNFWTIPLLMLARGVDFCMINALPGTPTFTDSVGRAVVLSLERPSHFIEAIGTAVGRQSQIKVDQTEEVPNIQPASVNRFSTVLSGKNRISTSNTLRPIIQYLGMEKFNLKFFGVSPVDETSIPLTSNVKR